MSQDNFIPSERFFSLGLFPDVFQGIFSRNAPIIHRKAHVEPVAIKS
jgi:hypothetical protein